LKLTAVESSLARSRRCKLHDELRVEKGESKFKDLMHILTKKHLVLKKGSLLGKECRKVPTRRDALGFLLSGSETPSERASRRHDPENRVGGWKRRY